MEATQKEIKELSRKAFTDGLDTLRKGKIPGNMSSIVCHIKGTTKELMEYAEALSECVFRQNNQIKLLENIISSGKQAGAKLTFDVLCLNDEHIKAVREWLDYGFLRGLGQWRNSGKGRFIWREIACTDADPR